MIHRPHACLAISLSALRVFGRGRIEFAVLEEFFQVWDAPATAGTGTPALRESACDLRILRTKKCE